MESNVSNQSNPGRTHRVTLVLGGGWKLGRAFHAGVILALYDTWEIDGRSVDSVIGTSSGAVVGGLLGAGMSPKDLFQHETAAELSPAGQALMAKVDRTSSSVGDDALDVDSQAVKRTRQLHRTLGLSARGALTALLPRGKQSTDALEGYFDDLCGHGWPTTTDLQLCAVDLGTGQRVALGRDSGATIGQAIAASCAVPGVSRPVPIRDREYVDGAIYSINNADLAVAIRNDRTSNHAQVEHTVIISAPLSVSNLQVAFGPLGMLRNAMHLQTSAEVRKLRDICQGSTLQVVVIEPTRADIAAMGPDMNANPRRRRVAYSAYATALGLFREADAPALESLVGAST